MFAVVLPVFAVVLPVFAVVLPVFAVFAIIFIVIVATVFALAATAPEVAIRFVLLNDKGAALCLACSRVVAQCSALSILLVLAFMVLILSVALFAHRRTSEQHKAGQDEHRSSCQTHVARSRLALRHACACFKRPCLLHLLRMVL